MAVDGQAALISALEARRFDDITGTPESDWVDFKLTVYPFEESSEHRLSQRGRWELCKDVASFANANGGSLVVGFEEITSPTLGVMVAGELRPIPIDRVDVGHYRDVLQQAIYPPINVEILWFADGTPAKGALLISVARTTEQPHVLRRLVTEADESIEALGIPVRNADRTIWYSAERVHHLIGQGGRPSISEESFEVDAGKHWERADQDRDRLVDLLDWKDKPVYVLQAVPTGGPDPLSGFYDKVKEALERPPSLRPMGFNLGGLGGLTDVISGALVVQRAGDASAWLDPDGLLTVAVVASPDFLGWALNRDPAQKEMNINSTTLVEYTLEFCRFVNLVLKPLAGDARWEYRVECHEFMAHHVFLGQGMPDRMFPSEMKRATDDTWSKRVPSTGDSEEVAFALLSNVYALFGLPESAIPYATDRRVDTKKLRQLDQS